MRYTYDDDEAFDSDATSTRRSARHSARSTPFEAGPTVTSSGRQVRQPRTGEYGESLLSAPPISTDELAPGYSDPERPARSTRSARSGTEDSEEPVRGHGRSTRAAVNGRGDPRKRGYNDIDGMSDEDDAEPSEDEWDSDKNGDGDEDMADVEDDGDDGDDDVSDADEQSDELDIEPKSLVIKLKIAPENLSKANGNSLDPHHGYGAVHEPKDPETISHKVALDADGSRSFLTTAGAQQHPNSSPAGPSSYPTPTSTSFLPTEQKTLVTTSLDVPQNTAGFPASTVPPQTNGVHGAKLHETIPKVEDREQMTFASANGFNGH